MKTKITIAIWLLVALVVLAATAQAINTRNEEYNAEFREIMQVIRDVNVRKVDKVSKDLFDDFFNQKEQIYRSGTDVPKNIPQAPSIKESAIDENGSAAPEKAVRRSY